MVFLGSKWLLVGNVFYYVIIAATVVFGPRFLGPHVSGINLRKSGFFRYIHRSDAQTDVVVAKKATLFGVLMLFEGSEQQMDLGPKNLPRVPHLLLV